MDTGSQSAFECFVRQRRADLRRIAGHTRNEYQFDDVVSVTWLMAQEMCSTKGIPIDFRDKDYQEHLLAFTYQELVRYDETQVRHATRLDHGRPDHDEDEHPLTRTLASNNGRDPLAELLAREEAQQTLAADAGDSLAAAYVYLLGQLGGKMKAVADFLLISVSMAYRHCARARWLARHQLPIPLDHTENFQFRLKPWRRFRFQREPVQLELPLAFDEELALGDLP